MVKYSTVSIPKELHEEIRKTILANPRYRYRSVAEFSLEAIKIRLNEIRAQLEEEKGIRKKKVERALKNIKRKLRLK
ncbi:MAG: hypothetical protein FE045_03660 [Thermoplasmata archaeon]|nr:MAG: hypothetical protein FE045_03660 [Thermoplasmata archaeon]